MILLVTDKQVSPDNDIRIVSVEESLELIKSWPVVQFDTETTGLDPHICHLTSMQFGYKDFRTGEQTQIVVDCQYMKPELYKTAIENSLLIGHNLKFDLKFLFNHSIVPLNVYDTMICEQVLYLGYKPGRVSMKLGDVLMRYTGIELNKSFQKKIATKGLTEEGIRYAANDVKHLQDIRKGQMLVAESRNCLKAFALENRFVPAIAYLEWCGVHLDEEKWKQKMDKDIQYLSTTRAALDNYVMSNTKLNKEFVTSYSQPSLWDADPSFTPKCSVDWDSPAQVIPVVKALGFNTEARDKATGRIRDSVDEKTLPVQKGIDDEFLKLYFDYKGAAKTVSSYGQGHLNLINPKTGRLHTEFNQIGTVTGRMSSGGGMDKMGKKNPDLARIKHLLPEEVRYVNLQNLPSRGEEGKIARSCFTAMPGNTFVSVDYSAEESRVQADVWNEETLLESFKNGIDTHNLYAKLCFPEELSDIDVKDVKRIRPDLRQAAKAAEFAIGYGSDGSAIAKSIGMSVDKAKSMVQGILKGMPGMASFKKKAARFVKEHGYIIINHKTGHRVYWPEWAQWKTVEDSFDRDFWNNYALYHQHTGDEVCQKVKKHKGEFHNWSEKNVLNYPIQGGSAIVLKHAAGDLFRWVVKNGYFGKILFCVFVHDEIDCECPSEIAESFSKKLQEIMENAAGVYYKRLKIPAEASLGDHWIH